MKRQDILTIPNVLTIFRILLLPFFLYCYLNQQLWMAAGIFAMCGITDFLDGFIARKYHMVSELGKMLDPFADKLGQLVLLIALLMRVPQIGYVIVLFLIKEGGMLICWLILQKKGGYLNGALWFGKVSTAICYVTMVLLLLPAVQTSGYADLLLWITAAGLSVSFVCYMKTYADLFRRLKETEES